jgi:hypothetical protein
MSIATGARSQVTYIPEVTWGVTPGTPQMVGLPYTSFGVNLTKTVYEDASIQADRMLRYSVHGNKAVAGPLAVNYAATDFDPLLESLFNSTWTSNVLKTGSTVKSFSFEQGSLDINQYSVYTGVQVNSLTLDVPVNGLCKATFNLVGKGMTISGTTLDSTITAATASQPFFHAGGTFKEGGTTVAIITAINLTIDNGTTTNYALGSSDAHGLTLGMSKVSGTVTAYFEDSTIVSKFIAGTTTSLEFTLTDGTKSHTYKMSGVKYNGATKTIGSQGPILISLPFTAVYNGTDVSNVMITRV